MKKIILFPCLVFVLLTLEAQTDSKVEGYWQWSYNPNLGMTEDSQTFFHIFEKEGKLIGEAFGVRNGKKEMLNHLKIRSVKKEGEYYILELPWANHFYKGKISKDSESITGFIRHHAQKDDLKLTRVDDRFN